MPGFEILVRIAATNVASLVWKGDTLVDWAGGGVRYQLDGTTVSRSVIYAYRFNAACTSSCGKYAVIYERLGTKGVVLCDGKILREINRSFYHANVYEYPIALARLKSGRDVLIHCPDEYNQLEIEDVETGESLTQREDRKPFDFFHSRLAVDAASGLLLSAGWIWHPFDALCVYDLEAAIQDPRTLDDSGKCPIHSTEITSATVLDNGQLAITTSAESFEDEEYDENELQPGSISVWDVTQASIVSHATLEDPAGTLMAVGHSHVVGFYECPKIINVRTGQTVAKMEGVESGKQTSSIIHHLDAIPPLALDPVSRRFAIATDQEILIVKIKIDES